VCDLPSSTFASSLLEHCRRIQRGAVAINPEVAQKGRATLRAFWVISPHGIAMMKDLYFTAVLSSLFLSFFFIVFFSTINVWGHWTDFDQTWTHIHLWRYLENLVITPPGIYPHGMGGQKPAFWHRLWTLISATEHDINSPKNLSIYRDSPIMLPKNNKFKFHQIFSTCYLWPWFGPFLMTMQ